MSKTKSMKYQVKQILGSTCCFGRSKHTDKKKNGQHPYGIYSVETFNTYATECSRFGSWCKENFGIAKIELCEQYVGPYLSWLTLEEKAPASLHTTKFALQKLYSIITPGYRCTFNLPKRERKVIKKNRSAIESIKGYAEKRHQQLASFGKATGLRRSELKNLRHCDIHVHNKSILVHVVNGKGGKERYVSVLPEFSAFVESFANQSKERVFTDIPVRFPEHRYRRFYAQTLYRLLARPLSELCHSERYYCRKDLRGTIYDRVAMLKVSKNLGHERVGVIAEHYL